MAQGLKQRHWKLMSLERSNESRRRLRKSEERMEDREFSCSELLLSDWILPCMCLRDPLLVFLSFPHSNRFFFYNLYLALESFRLQCSSYFPIYWWTFGEDQAAWLWFYFFYLTLPNREFRVFSSFLFFSRLPLPLPQPFTNVVKGMSTWVEIPEYPGHINKITPILDRVTHFCGM